jgi:hypothetical protein
VTVSFLKGTEYMMRYADEMHYLMHIATENLILFLQSYYKTLWSNDTCFLLLITDLYAQRKRIIMQLQ